MFLKPKRSIFFIFLCLTNVVLAQDFNFSADEFENELYDKEVIEFVVSSGSAKLYDPSAQQTLDYLEIELSEMLDGVEPIKSNKRVKGINKINQEGLCCMRFTKFADDTTQGYELDFSKIICSTIEIIRKNHPQSFAYGYALKMSTKEGLQYIRKISKKGWKLGDEYNSSSLEFYDWAGRTKITVEEIKKLRQAFIHACKKCGGYDYVEPNFPDY